MRSVVTGGAGFIGSHLVDALIARGDAVLVLDDLSTGSEANLSGARERGAELVVGDLAEAGFAGEQIARFEPDRVFHLAAQADVRVAVEDPAFDARVNVVGTVRVLEAARAAMAPVVFASTGGAIYGEGEGRSLPFVEDAELLPETGYGTGKLAGEQYLALYRRLHGLPGLALRLGNVYGPRQDPHGEAGVVAIFCGRLAAGERPIVFGDGLQTRDYVYVGDVAWALLAAGDAVLERGSELAGALNVGRGEETSVLDLIDALARIAGVAAEPDYRDARQGEIRRVAIDPGAAARELGWRPEVGLEQGLELTYRSVGERPARLPGS